MPFKDEPFGVDLRVKDRSIQTKELFFQNGYSTPSFFPYSDTFVHGSTVLRVNPSGDGVTDNLVCGFRAKHSQGRRIEIPIDGVGLDRYAHGCALDHQAEAFLALAQCLLRPLPLGDVPQGAEKASSIKILELDTSLDVDNLPILATVAGLKSVHSLVDDSLHMSCDVLLALGAFQVRNAHPQQFFAGVAGHHAIGVINLHQPPLGIHKIEAVQCSLQNRLQMLCMLPQGMFCFPALPFNFETIQCKREVQRQLFKQAGFEVIHRPSFGRGDCEHTSE